MSDPKERMRQCIESGERAEHDDPPGDWIELMRLALRRIESLEEEADAAEDALNRSSYDCE